MIQRRWTRIAVGLACLFGVIKKFRPGTPFLAPFLESPEFKNFSNDQLYSEIYPYWTYSNMISLIPIFFLSDFFHYQPIIVLEALTLCGTWAFLVYGQTVFHMQIMQLLFGLATSSDVAYSAYLYAVVKPHYYKRVTSYFQTAAMSGKFLAYSLGQILVWTNVASYLTLNKISLYAMIFCIPLAVCLPRFKPKKCTNVLLKDLSNKNNSTDNGLPTVLLKEENSETLSTNESIMKSTLLSNMTNNLKLECNTSIISVKDHKICRLSAAKKFACDYLQIYNNSTIFIWSLWWILTACGMLQIFNYIQTLWALRQQNGQITANGFVESLNTLIGACVIFMLQYSNFDWEFYATEIFAVSSVYVSANLFAMIYFKNIFVDYFCYLFISTFYYVLIALASQLIAVQVQNNWCKQISSFTDDVERVEKLRTNPNGFSFVFGLNSLLALFFQSTLTWFIADKNGLLVLNIENQFISYAIYFLVIGVLFAVISVTKCVRHCCSESNLAINSSALSKEIFKK